MELTAGTQLIPHAGGANDEIAEAITQPKRPGLKVYRLVSGHQLYTKAYLFKHFTVQVA